GRPPCAGTRKQVEDPHLNQPPPPLHTWRPELPRAACHVIEQALAKDPTVRPTPARALATAIAAAAVQVPSDAPELDRTETEPARALAEHHDAVPSSAAAEPAHTAQFNAPSGLALSPDGTVYIADTANHRIRKVAPDGT